MNTWMDLLAIMMVCLTAIFCTAMLAAPQRVDKDDDKK